MIHIKQYINENSERFLTNNFYYYSYGFSRSLIALSLLLTFVFNDVNILFKATSINQTVPYCNFNPISIFCLLHNDLYTAKIISIVILCIVVSGWRPRITGILHWWISYSFISSTPMVDGGDHAASVITFFFVPITFFDNRKWHWLRPEITHVRKSLDLIKKIIPLTFFKIVRLQIAIIYLHAAVGKCSVNDWINGTAIYYWMTDPIFGMTNNLKRTFLPILANPFWVAILTWGVIIFEFLLFTGYFMNRREKNILLVFGILFHILIAVFLGLVSFALIMTGALIVYLLEIDNPIIVKKIKNKL